MKLTIEYSELSTEQKLRLLWADFCDADPVPPEFPDEMEAAGFIDCVPVDKDALESPFAYERGLEPGGSMYVLTPAGRQALKGGE